MAADQTCVYKCGFGKCFKNIFIIWESHTLCFGLIKILPQLSQVLPLFHTHLILYLHFCKPIMSNYFCLYSLVWSAVLWSVVHLLGDLPFNKTDSSPRSLYSIHTFQSSKHLPTKWIRTQIANPIILIEPNIKYTIINRKHWHFYFFYIQSYAYKSMTHCV